MSQESLEKKAYTSLFWKFFERFGYQIAQFVIQIFLARLLTPNDFGLMAILLIIVNIANVIVQSGLNTALIQAKQIDETDISSVFWVCFGFSLAIYAGIFVFSDSISGFFDSLQLSVAIKVVAIVVIINSFNSIQVALIIRELQTVKLFKGTVCAVIVSGVISVTCAYLGFALWSLIIQQISYQVVYSVILLFQNKWFPRFVFSLKRAKSFFSFGWRVLISGLIDTVYQALYDLSIGRSYGSYFLGLYSQGKKIPQTLCQLFDSTVRSVLLSIASKLQDEVNLVKDVTRKAMMVSTFVIAPVMLCLALISPTLVVLLFGEAWREAAVFMQLLCLAYMFWPIHTSNLQTINALGRSDVVLRLEVIKKIVGVSILIFMLVVVKDLYWVVVGKVIGSLISIFINAYPSKQLIGYSYKEQFLDIVPAYLIAGVSVLLSSSFSLFNISEVPLMLIEILATFVIYVLLCRIFSLKAFLYLNNALLKLIRNR